MSNFLLPSPNFNKNIKDGVKTTPYYLTPCGMSLLPRQKQPPPMYGPRGATVPAKYLNKNGQIKNSHPQETSTQNTEVQFCESCDMELKSLKDLRLHLAQHEACPVEGCSFLGHPHVMDAHVETLHAARLRDQVKKLSTPEEIAAWREERRKRYPTLENVSMRQRAQEQRLQRGERIEANQERFGHVEDRKRARVQGKKKRKGKKLKRNANTLKSDTSDSLSVKVDHKKPAERTHEPKAVQSAPVPVKQMSTDEDSCAGILMFRGTSKLKGYKHAKAIKEKNVLTHLLGIYDSNSESSEDSEEDDETRNLEVPAIKLVGNGVSTDKTEKNSQDVEIEKHTKNAVPTVTTMETSETTLNQCSDEEPEEAPIARIPNFPTLTSTCLTAQPVPAEIAAEKDNSVEKPNPASTQRKPRFRRKSGLDYTKARLRKQNTMLEKLLQPEIKHERNVLLQCVRFVCENNYFDIGSKNKAPET